MEMSMDFNFLTAIFVAFNLVTLVSSLCDDLNGDACTSLKNLVPDMCNDMCIADVCRRTCNICPLQCYDCPQTFYPEECKRTKECNGSEVCVAMQELSQDFLPLYYSDCMTKRECLEIFGGINTGLNKRAKLIQKRDYALNGSCCDHDFCNQHDPQKTPTEKPNVEIRPTPPTKDYGTTCGVEDQNVTACALIKAADPYMCKKSCFSQFLCPQTCQKCNKCYNCVNVKDPSMCQRTRQCKTGQHCIEIHTLDDEFEPVYKLGCASTNICNVYFGGVNLDPTLVPVQGKRQIGHQGFCCDKPFCNGPDPSVTTPAMNLTTGQVKDIAPTITVTQVVTGKPDKPSTMVQQTTVQTASSTAQVQTTTMPAATQPPTTQQPATQTATLQSGTTQKPTTQQPATQPATLPPGTTEMPTTMQPATQPATTLKQTKPPSTAPPVSTTEVFTIPPTSPETTLTPDPSCPDEGMQCRDTSQTILCDTKIQSRKDFAIRKCASTCNLCKEYFEWKNATATVSTAKPCTDEPTVQCFSLICLDPKSAKYASTNCAKFCGLC